MRGEGRGSQLVEGYHVVDIRVRGEMKGVWVWRCSLSLCVETRASNSICLSIALIEERGEPRLKSSQGDG